jgi:uncharacterized integral membrane protein
MMQFYLIVALTLATLVAIFAIQNAEQVTIRFLLWTFQTSTVIVILISAGVGALLAALLSLPQNVKVRRRLRQTEEEMERLVAQDPRGRLGDGEVPKAGSSGGGT